MNYLASVRPDMLKNGTTRKTIYLYHYQPFIIISLSLSTIHNHYQLITILAKDCMKKASEKWKEMDTKAKAKFDTTE